MGDMLAKSGDWPTAQRIYANARLSPDYAKWRLRAVLEQRIMDEPENVSRFNATETRSGEVVSRIMFASRFACMACHQE